MGVSRRGVRNVEGEIAAPLAAAPRRALEQGGPGLPVRWRDIDMGDGIERAGGRGWRRSHVDPDAQAVIDRSDQQRLHRAEKLIVRGGAMRIEGRLVLPNLE